MTQQELLNEKIEQEINRLLDKGVPRVDISILEYFSNYKPNDDVLFLADFLIDDYKEYRNLIKKLDILEEPFLTTIKNEEIKSNQKLEDVNGFVIDLLLNSKVPCTTNNLIEQKNKNTILNKLGFINSHKVLLLGAEELNKTTIRKDNSSIVKLNEHEVDYIPIDYKYINQAIEHILSIYNDSTIQHETDIFFKPILLHGLIASLQLFTDGNTRLGRVYQNILMWDLSKNIDSFKDLNTPILYSSLALLKHSTKNEYRQQIKDIATNPSNLNLNNFLYYKLLNIENQLNLNKSKIEETAKTFNKRLY